MIDGAPEFRVAGSEQQRIVVAQPVSVLFCGGDTASHMVLELNPLEGSLENCERKEKAALVRYVGWEVLVIPLCGSLETQYGHQVKTLGAIAVTYSWAVRDIIARKPECVDRVSVGLEQGAVCVPEVERQLGAPAVFIIESVPSVIQ